MAGKRAREHPGDVGVVLAPAVSPAQILELSELGYRGPSASTFPQAEALLKQLRQGRRPAPPVKRTRSQGENERGFLLALTELSQRCGWFVYHTHDSRHSVAGFPDIVAVKAGEPLILAELKTAVGRVTPLQQAWLDVLGQAVGLEVHVWRPEHWPEIEALFLRR